MVVWDDEDDDDDDLPEGQIKEVSNFFSRSSLQYS